MHKIITKHNHVIKKKYSFFFQVQKQLIYIDGRFGVERRKGVTYEVFYIPPVISANGCTKQTKLVTNNHIAISDNCSFSRFIKKNTTNNINE